VRRVVFVGAVHRARGVTPQAPSPCVGVTPPPPPLGGQLLLSPVPAVTEQFNATLNQALVL